MKSLSENELATWKKKRTFTLLIFLFQTFLLGANYSVERPITIKDARIEKPNKQSVLIVKGHMLPPTKGVRLTKNRHLGNMWWTTKNHMPPSYAKTWPLHNPKIRPSHFRPTSLLNL